MAAVSERLRATGKETIVSLPPPYGWYHGYDYAALAPLEDAIQLMANNYVDQGPEPAAEVEEAIRGTLESIGEAHRQKVLLGILASSETPETLTQKVGLAKRYSLGGITVWALRWLTPEQMDALDRTVARR